MFKAKKGLNFDYGSYFSVAILKVNVDILNKFPEYNQPCPRLVFEYHVKFV